VEGGGVKWAAGCGARLGGGLFLELVNWVQQEGGKIK